MVGPTGVRGLAIRRVRWVARRNGPPRGFWTSARVESGREHAAMSTPSLVSDTDPRTVPGNGGLPKVVLLSAGGARAEVYLHGAHVTSWIARGRGGRPAVPQRDGEVRDQAAIRGGVPVCFPQFAAQGPLPMHGFARVCDVGSVDAHGRTDAGAARVVLRLADSAATRALWPHAFVAEMCVTVAGARSSCWRSVENVGTDGVRLHRGAAHLPARRRCRAAAVRGLSGARFHDKVLASATTSRPARSCASTARSTASTTPRPEDLALWEPRAHAGYSRLGLSRHRRLEPRCVRNAGQIADLEPGGYARMVCVEAARTLAARARGRIARAGGMPLGRLATPRGALSRPGGPR